jgi:hypothetical protein
MLKPKTKTIYHLFITKNIISNMRLRKNKIFTYDIIEEMSDVVEPVEELTEHSVSLSPAQVSKMRRGLNVSLSPKHFTANGNHIISVHPLTHKRILSAIRRGKGLKISLKPAEDLFKKTTGGKISLKGIGRAITRGFHKAESGLKSFGHQAEKGINRVGKVVAKPMVDALIQGGIPAVLGVTGEVLGGPLGGIAGSVAGSAVANAVQRQANKSGLGVKKRGRPRKVVEGEGLYRTLHKLGISKRKAVNTFKHMGKNALKLGATAVGDALNKYGVPANVSAPLLGSIEHIGEKAIDKGTVKSLKSAGHQSMKEIKKVAKTQALGYLDKQLDKLPPEIREVAENALDKVELREGVEMDPHMIGAGANVYASLPYRLAMKRISGGAIKRPMVEGSVGEMTLSPYLSYSSPAMHPFVPHRNELQGYNPIKGVKGGSIYPAGYRRGNGFVPAG